LQQRKSNSNDGDDDEPGADDNPGTDSNIAHTAGISDADSAVLNMASTAGSSAAASSQSPQTLVQQQLAKRNRKKGIYFVHFHFYKLFQQFAFFL